MEASRQRVILTACQVRMARSAQRWSVEDLAERSGVGEKTIRRVEKVYGIPPNVTIDTLLKLQACFEAHGMTFIPEDGSPEGPGVRFGSYPGRQVQPVGPLHGTDQRQHDLG
ncbi:helix-turn-helix domain-containing protein [Methylobacterium oxalidis]|nr:helix-turn-helix domain-containing protein [Methylobacterium oxalidis]